MKNKTFYDVTKDLPYVKVQIPFNANHVKYWMFVCRFSTSNHNLFDKINFYFILNGNKNEIKHLFYNIAILYYKKSIYLGVNYFGLVENDFIWVKQSNIKYINYSKIIIQEVKSVIFNNSIFVKPKKYEDMNLYYKVLYDYIIQTKED